MKHWSQLQHIYKSVRNNLCYTFVFILLVGIQSSGLLPSMTSYKISSYPRKVMKAINSLIATHFTNRVCLAFPSRFSERTLLYSTVTLLIKANFQSESINGVRITLTNAERKFFKHHNNKNRNILFSIVIQIFNFLYRMIYQPFKEKVLTIYDVF